MPPGGPPGIMAGGPPGEPPDELLDADPGPPIGAMPIAPPIAWLLAELPDWLPEFSATPEVDDEPPPQPTENNNVNSKVQAANERDRANLLGSKEKGQARADAHCMATLCHSAGYLSRKT